LRAGGLLCLFLGHIDDPVIAELYFLQISLLHVIQECGIGGFGVFAAVDKNRIL